MRPILTKSYGKLMNTTFYKTKDIILSNSLFIIIIFSAGWLVSNSDISESKSQSVRVGYNFDPH
jgi:hypothetical protein